MKIIDLMSLKVNYNNCKLHQCKNWPKYYLIILKDNNYSLQSVFVLIDLLDLEVSIGTAEVCVWVLSTNSFTIGRIFDVLHICIDFLQTVDDVLSVEEVLLVVLQAPPVGAVDRLSAAPLENNPAIIRILYITMYFL